MVGKSFQSDRNPQQRRMVAVEGVLAVFSQVRRNASVRQKQLLRTLLRLVIARRLHRLLPHQPTHDFHRGFGSFA
jgi:hypothetical protein